MWQVGLLGSEGAGKMPGFLGVFFLDRFWFLRSTQIVSGGWAGVRLAVGLFMAWLGRPERTDFVPVSFRES